jgi:low affinity Fe/Cu permease
MINHKDKSLLDRLGHQVSSWVSDVAADPFAQIGVIVVCALWWIVGLPTDILTATLSILAITLTQMVLNRQNEREAEAHRRDVAMHAKLDELVLASRRARDEMAGIEDLEEEEIEHLKEEAKDAIHAVQDDSATPAEREVAEEAIEKASGKLKAEAAPKNQPRRRAAQGSK